jgi:hypothetical protein
MNELRLWNGRYEVQGWGWRETIRTLREKEYPNAYKHLEEIIVVHYSHAETHQKELF